MPNWSYFNIKRNTDEVIEVKLYGSPSFSLFMTSRLLSFDWKLVSPGITSFKHVEQGRIPREFQVHPIRNIPQHLFWWELILFLFVRLCVMGKIKWISILEINEWCMVQRDFVYIEFTLFTYIHMLLLV